jgi:phosphatidylserine/phosphatidylglycerophosphate/cardiolipin synthase-like enzyme
MGLETHQFGPNKRITAHLLTQVGIVSAHSEATAEQAQQAEAVGKIYADFVSKATFSLHIAIYDFRLTGAAGTAFVAALNERAKAGVDVRVAYHHAKKDRTPEVFAYLGADPAPPGTDKFVDKLDPAVLRKGIKDTAELEVPVQDEPIDPGSHLMHSKYIIRDGNLPSAAVLMGSTNFTNDAWSLQDNNIVLFEQAPELARYYANDFGELWQSGQISNSGRDDTGTVTIDGMEVSVAFSPGQGRQIDTDIASAIGSAQDRLLVASMVISSGAVLGALVDRAHRVAEFGGIFDGPEMRGVMRDWARAGGGPSAHSAHPHTADSAHAAQGQHPAAPHRITQHVTHGAAPVHAAHGTRAHVAAHHGNSLAQIRSGASQGKAQLFASIAPLLHAKGSLTYGANTPHNFMHNKLSVCDNTVVTGSFNFSTNATRNAENVVIIKSQDVADVFAAYVRELMQLYPHMGLPQDVAPAHAEAGAG